MFDIEDIRRRLERHQPVRKEEPPRRRAAVAMVLRVPHPSGSPEILFIERARHDGDPWSGHMAFPGGRVDPGDSGDRAAAERETLEEVNVDLSGARYLGRLSDLEGRHAGRPAELVISAHVYHAQGHHTLRPNYEVEETFWFPLAALHDPARHVDYSPFGRPGSSMPGVCVGDPERHIVWGLTYRFLELFFEMLDRPLVHAPDQAGSSATSMTS
ncbi:MAG: NUDIX hydrolase [Myxococcota bacterium]